MNASISGAEVGCQGEVGVACSMAAAGLAAVLGGTNEQIGTPPNRQWKHHLGMTCDPIGGLVQYLASSAMAFGGSMRLMPLPRTEGRRNAYRIARQGHRDDAQTGRDMQSKYRASLGGLAVNLPNAEGATVNKSRSIAFSAPISLTPIRRSPPQSPANSAASATRSN